MNRDRTASVPGWLMEFAANIVRQLPRDMDETTAQGWNSNQKALKEALAKALLPDRLANNKQFTLLKTFELTVPEDYEHAKQLTLFSKNRKKEFYYYNDNITDENFAKVTDKLVPGETYSVKIFGITEPVSSEDILAFLKAWPGIRFTGAQGLSLVYQENREKFPMGKYTISIDAKDALWEDADGYCGVPSMGRNSDGDWDFHLDDFKGGWGGDSCVLYFCDLSDK